jgi:SAM-dependent methyltransferase
MHDGNVLMAKQAQTELQPQLDRSTYFLGGGYLAPARFASYGHQLSEIVRQQPANVLEIGIGNGVVSQYLSNAGIDTTTVDFDPALEPDVLASVTDLPIADSAFDAVACFEVLEHLPFESFPCALEELHRVCRRYALISLPDSAPYFRLHIPRLLPNKLYERPFHRPREHAFDGEHYWEVNKQGFPLSKIIGCMNDAGFSVERTWRLYEIPKIRMFRLSKVPSQTVDANSPIRAK